MSIMSGNVKCSLCEAEAIGIQMYGCCSICVCSGHADPRLLDLEPGEVLAFGDCYFKKFQDRPPNREDDEEG